MQYRSLVLSLALATGCAVEAEDQLASSSSNVEVPNRLAANRLAANRLAANKLAGATLSTASVDLQTMAATSDGLELLSYMFSCAEPPGVSLTVNGTVLTGGVGLAPDWTTRPLTASERKWVSACLLARVNYYGVSVQLSLRGEASALAISTEERTDFTLVEGAFWGDVFTGEEPQVMHACPTAFKASDPQMSTLPLRQCAVPSSTTPAQTWCGFTAHATCESACSNQASSDKFWNCDGSGSEVITVSLARP